jgi:glycosyltransferase involved in cell wall biosynthesis
MHIGRDVLESYFGAWLPSEKFHALTWLLPSEFKQNRKNYLAAKFFREVMIESVNPGIVFSTNLQEGFEDGIAITGVKSPSKTKYVTTLHDLVPFYFYKEYLGDIDQNSWYFDKITDALKSDRIITDSAEAFQDISKLMGAGAEGKLSWLYPGVSSAFIQPSGPQHSKDIVDFIYYGGSDPHKNLDVIFNSLNLLQEKVKRNARFMFVGLDVESSIKRKFDNSFESANILFLGYLDNDKLIETLQGADCLIFPSIKEGFGLPIVEGMAVGLTVLAANTTTGRELLNNNADFLFDPYDPYDLARRIEKLVIDHDYLWSAKQKCREAFLAHDFSWDMAAKQVITVFDRLTDKTNIAPPIPKSRNECVIDFIAQCEKSNLSFTYKECLEITKSFSLSSRGQKHQAARLFVDCSVIHQHDHRTGIQRVVRALIFNLKMAQKIDVIPVYSDDLGMTFRTSNILDQSKNGELTGKIIDFNPGDVLLMADLHPGLAINMHTTGQGRLLKNNNIRLFHIVYDILPITSPETFWPELVSEFEAWLKAIRNANGLLCISKTVANELQRYYGSGNDTVIGQPAIHWFHLGFDIGKSIAFQGVPGDANEVLNRFKSRTTFLMVGTIEPRKGHALAVDAFELLWRQGEDINLAIVGKQGWKMKSFIERLQVHPEAGRRLFWLGGISDQYLEIIFKESKCLLMASYGEGFGLPLIEASHYGLPLVVRDIPVFREVAADHAYFFQDSRDPSVLASAIKEWLVLYKQEKHPSSVGVASQSWGDSANHVLNIIFGGAHSYASVMSA